MTISEPAVQARRDAVLRLTAIVFAAGYLVHVLDHMRRGPESAPPEVFAIGTVQGMLVAVTIWMVLTRRPQAPLAAILVGFGSALLFTAGHLLPFSPDTYLGGVDPTVTWFSWTSAFTEIGTAILFGVAGLRARAAP